MEPALHIGAASGVTALRLIGEIMPYKGTKMSEEGQKRLSETRKRLFTQGRLAPWNKGLTKKDHRVFKNISGGSRKTQFKKGPKPETAGRNNANWKGGKRKSSAGYILIRNKTHPRSQNGYIFEHTLMAEKKLGRYLKLDELVHHINENKEDNRPENLAVIYRGSHVGYHRWGTELKEIDD